MKIAALMTVSALLSVIAAVVVEPPPTRAAALQSSVRVLPVGPVAVAPGQPPVGSAQAATPDQQGVRTASPTAGIINAVCSVRLNIVNCGFFPTSGSLSCDRDGDGTGDQVIPLTDITLVNSLLVRVTLAPAPGVPGSPFPLDCCGGLATLTLQRTVGAGDDNIFGPFTQTLTTVIDLGLRAPIVVSATPSTADCAAPQNLLVSGSCFVLPDGSNNVTSVFAVERGNPANVIQAASFVVLTPNLIDADFNFGSQNAGKAFLIFVNGPNGQSRNLTTLPFGAGATCPLGNEKGIQVMFTCASVQQETRDAAIVNGCVLERTPTGAFVLTITGSNIKAGASITIDGVSARKNKFKQFSEEANAFRSVVLKGGLCNLVPGLVVITNPSGDASNPFQCNATCQ